MCNVYRTDVLVFALLFSSGVLLLIPPLYVSTRHHLYNLTVDVLARAFYFALLFS